MLVLLMTTGIVTGCAAGKKESPDNKKLSIVCTIFPQYDWIKQILGDQSEQIDLTLLIDTGVDLHSYQPTAEDILTISTCDLFVYVGGESDAWVKDALAEAVNQDMVVINLLEVLGETVKEEELVEGMEAEGEEAESEQSSTEAVDDAQAEEPEYDEHVWLSLKNAKVICQSLVEAVSQLDTGNKDDYRSNCDTYIGKLDDLDQAYETMTANASYSTVLFGDRFPFRYMVDDYDLTYYAAFVGCSAETEASFDTIVFLANKVDELELPVVLVIDGSDQKIAETIINNTTDKNQKILTMDSMQSITAQDIEEGVSYLEIMKDNLVQLTEALHENR